MYLNFATKARSGSRAPRKSNSTLRGPSHNTIPTRLTHTTPEEKHHSLWCSSRHLFWKSHPESDTALVATITSCAVIWATWRFVTMLCNDSHFILPCLCWGELWDSVRVYFARCWITFLVHSPHSKLYNKNKSLCYCKFQLTLYPVPLFDEKSFLFEQWLVRRRTKRYVIHSRISLWGIYYVAKIQSTESRAPQNKN